MPLYFKGRPGPPNPNIGGATGPPGPPISYSYAYMYICMYMTYMYL